MDATQETLRPDTVAQLPGVRFLPYPPRRESIRKDVNLSRP
ncbi:MAG: hypothetical protein DIU52_006055 [bacterium]